MGDDMKILDTLGKSKKAIGGVIAIIVLVIAIFFAGVHMQVVVTMIKLLQQPLKIN